MGAEGTCEKSQCGDGGVGQAVRPARAGCTRSCTAYFLCDLSAPLKLPGPQFPHMSGGVGSRPLMDDVS